MPADYREHLRPARESGNDGMFEDQRRVTELFDIGFKYSLGDHDPDSDIVKAFKGLDAKHIIRHICTGDGNTEFPDPIPIIRKVSQHADPVLGYQLAMWSIFINQVLMGADWRFKYELMVLERSSQLFVPLCPPELIVGMSRRRSRSQQPSAERHQLKLVQALMDIGSDVAIGEFAGELCAYFLSAECQGRFVKAQAWVQNRGRREESLRSLPSQLLDIFRHDLLSWKILHAQPVQEAIHEFARNIAIQYHHREAKPRECCLGWMSDYKNKSDSKDE